MWKSEIKKLFQTPTDVYAVITPLYYVSRLLGLAQFKFNEKRKLKSNVGVITFLRILILICVYIYIVYESEDILSLNLLGVAVRLELYLGCTIILTVLSMAVIKRNSIIKILEMIDKVDNTYKRLNIAINYKNALKCIWFEVIGMVLIFSSKVIMQPFSHSGIMLIVYNVFNMVEFVDTMMLYQYTNSILLLRQRFVWLNQAIKKLKYIQKIEYNSVKNNSNVTEDVKDLLSEYGKLHYTMHLIALKINRTYGVQVTASFIIRFIMVMTQCVYTFMVIVDPSKGNGLMYFVLAFYLFLHLSKMFMVVSLSENTAQKVRNLLSSLSYGYLLHLTIGIILLSFVLNQTDGAKDTGIYIHRLWDCDEKIHELIQHFSDQILHQNTHFTACGFFKLNYALFASIIGSMTTYLIIIIQFNVATIMQPSTNCS